MTSGEFARVRAQWRDDRWVKPFFGQYRKALAAALGLGLLTFLCAAGLMFVAGFLISFSAGSADTFLDLMKPLALVQLFGIGKPILQYLERLTSHDWVLHMTSSLRLQLYRALERDAIFFRATHRAGDVLGLLDEDIGHLQNLYLRTVFPTIVAYALFVVVLVVAGVFSLPLAAALFVLIGAEIFLVPLVSVLVNAARRAQAKALRNELYAELTDNVLGVSDWVFSGRGAEYLARYRTTDEAMRALTRAENAYNRKRDLVMQLGFALVAVLLLVWAGFMMGADGAWSWAFNWIAAVALVFFPMIDAFAPVPQAAVDAVSYGDSVERLNALPAVSLNDDDNDNGNLSAAAADAAEADAAEAGAAAVDAAAAGADAGAGAGARSRVGAEAGAGEVAAAGAGKAARSIVGSAAGESVCAGAAGGDLVSDASLGTSEHAENVSRETFVQGENAPDVSRETSVSHCDEANEPAACFAIGAGAAAFGTAVAGAAESADAAAAGAENVSRETFVQGENAPDVSRETFVGAWAVNSKAEKGSAAPQEPLDLRIEGVSFTYPGSLRKVIDGLTLEVPQGQKVAVLGRSGAGKSTLMTLIRGDVAPDEGSVTVGGVPTRALGDDASRFFGVIQQQTYLFNMTLLENLRIGRADATVEEVWMAVARVGLLPMVERLPEGLGTMVDEAGLRFSGGERHRIALARVLLQDAPIIILDEPTVGLDPITERDLLRTLFDVLADKTIIMITHHLAGVASMDRVVFVEDGRVTLDGAPDELERQSARYRELLAFDQGI